MYCLKIYEISWSRAAPLSFAASFCERLDLVARHPDRNPDHKRSGRD